MKTRSRHTADSHERSYIDDLSETNLDLDALSDEEIEALLFEEEPAKPQGVFNLPTMAGLSLIVVGIAYLFQELGIWNGFAMGDIARMLPWLAGILIILIGFGVLSWRPNRKKKVRKSVKTASGTERIIVEPSGKRTTKKGRDGRKRQLVRSRDKKIAGVCAGVAEYFNLDPTLVRIAFVIGTIASGGPFMLAYIALAFIMPAPETPSLEERITIIRDS